MSTDFDEAEFETVEQRAAFWHLRLTSDDCTPEDRYAFEAWKREAPENAKAYDRVVKGHAFIDRHVAEPELRQLAQETLARTEPAPRKRWPQIAAIAACVAVAIGVGSVVLNTSINNPADVTALVQAKAYETAIGERSTVTLSDGSVVTLNTNSKMEVRFSAEERLVTLIQGQGFFDVEKDIDRPFAVEAGDKRVVALGTAFDVRFDRDNGVEVTLVEGRVSVDDVAQIAASIPKTVTEPGIELEPGQRLIAKSDSVAELVATNAEEETAWREGRLIFRERPIHDVIDEINRYSVQQLKLSDDPRIEEMRVSGVFNTGRASTFVSALERMHPLEATRSGQNELTLVWQE